MERTLSQIGWQGKSVYFAGRTDAGVHAAGQVVVFDINWNHTAKELQKALNAGLPPDISAMRVERVKSDFHPRYHALSREYHYQILCSPIRNPLIERYCWRVWPDLDIKVLQRTSRSLRGSHDFAALGTPHKPGGSTIRHIIRVAWKKTGNHCRFEITGNAFLYHMVRRIVMVLVQIGQGDLPVNALADYLENPSGPPSQGLAPARGLTLFEVQYS